MVPGSSQTRPFSFWSSCLDPPSPLDGHAVRRQREAWRASTDMRYKSCFLPIHVLFPEASRFFVVFPLMSLYPVAALFPPPGPYHLEDPAFGVPLTTPDRFGRIRFARSPLFNQPARPWTSMVRIVRLSFCRVYGVYRHLVPSVSRDTKVATLLPNAPFSPPFQMPAPRSAQSFSDRHVFSPQLFR